jgi:uncharacterized protein YbbC (DUF1343 family)
MKKVLLGIDVLKTEKSLNIKSERIGLLSSHASLDGDFNLSRDVVYDLYGKNLRYLFTPQHGFFGVLQDNMKESPHSVDERLNIPVYSLYSEVREPADEMFDEIDVLIVDLFDVGTRVYTFIYTMALCMKKVAELNKRVVVLDRPNPVSGTIEGNLVTDGFTSFVGMYPIPMRHGMTIGELSLLFNNEFGIGCDLHVIKMSGYKRDYYYDDTGLAFPFPSPNMPSLKSAVVYPGQVIFEGTNISEGRGTTRPFEIFGAPFIDPYELKASLKKYNLTGVDFKETYFKPTFNKHKDAACGGLFLHVTDRAEYKPYLTSIILLYEMINLYPEKTGFIKPPYEYEFEKLPFDIITGDDGIRKALYLKDGIERIRKTFKEGEETFAKTAEKYYLY